MADQILNALEPKPLTRGLIIGQKPKAMVDPAVKAREIRWNRIPWLFNF